MNPAREALDLSAVGVIKMTLNGPVHSGEREGGL